MDIGHLQAERIFSGNDIVHEGADAALIAGDILLRQLPQIGLAPLLAEGEQSVGDEARRACHIAALPDELVLPFRVEKILVGLRRVLGIE